MAEDTPSLLVSDTLYPPPEPPATEPDPAPVNNETVVDPQPEPVVEDGAETQNLDTESKQNDDIGSDVPADENHIVPTSFNELIESQEWDPEWAMSLEVPVKVDGKPAQATISEMVKSFQLGQAAEKRLEEAKAERDKTKVEAAEQQEIILGQFTVAARLLEEAEQLLLQDEKSIDEKLRVDDPGEYAARQADAKARRDRIEELKQVGQDAWTKQLAQGKVKATDRLKEILSKESAALVEKIPEWEDPKVAKAERAKLVDYLVSDEIGFSRDEVRAASDHRLIVLAYKAELYDAQQANTNAALKKVTKVPKIMRGGPAKPDPAPPPIDADAADILYPATG